MDDRRVGERMTGLRPDPLAALILVVSALVGGWQSRKGPRKVLDL